MNSTPIDIVTLEVIKNALGSTVDEMALIVARTAYSKTVRDALDYSTALCNPRGEMVAQGLGIAMHLGSFPSAVKSILTRYTDNLYPSDIFILNDPYGSGGIHLPDIYVIKPIFIDDELEALSCVVAHHTDVGGIVPGSNSTNATEIYQEGLRIPTLKLYERGVRNDAIFAFIEYNVRVPDKVLGDLRAQLAAVTSGERAYLELLDRYGASTLRRYVDELLDYSERLARAEIAAIPDGVYEFADYIDHDSVDPDPITIRVNLTVAGDQIVVDFDGGSQQVRGGIDCPLPFTESAVYAAIRLTMDPSLPNSDGYFRPIEVRAPLRSIVNPVLPGAWGARGITGFRIIDAVLGALSQAVPDRVPADGEGGNTLISWAASTTLVHSYTWSCSQARAGLDRGATARKAYRTPAPTMRIPRSRSRSRVIRCYSSGMAWCRTPVERENTVADSVWCASSVISPTTPSCSCVPIDGAFHRMACTVEERAPRRKTSSTPAKRPNARSPQLASRHSARVKSFATYWPVAEAGAIRWSATPHLSGRCSE